MIKMKRFFIPIMMAALLMTACGHRTSSNAADSDSVAVDTVFAVDSIGQMREDTMAMVKISIAWPKGSNEPLCASIRRYICEQLAAGLTMEGKPDVILYKDGKTAVKATLDKHYRNLVADRTDTIGGANYDGMQFSFAQSINLLEETDTYVTYCETTEGFLGGAHGSATGTGITFRKSDGKRIGYHTEFNRQTEQFEMKDQTLFSKPQSAALAALIKEGVRSYFQEFQDSKVTDKDLLGNLIGVNSVDSIPLPSNPPYFTKNGLAFIYQQYEIAPYAAGMINFDIAYDKIRPLLTKDAQQLIK